MATRKTASQKKKPKKKEEPVFYCTAQINEKCCEAKGVRPESKFYNSYSILAKNGKQHICKDCLKEFCIDEEGKIDLINFKIMLRTLDVPFLKAVWETSYNSSMETIGAYFKNLYLNNKGSNWDDSDRDADEYILEESVKLSKDELVEKWGKYPPDDLEWLEAKYEEWEMNTDCSLHATRELVKLICSKQLEIRHMREKNQDTDKKEKALLDLMSNGNLTPKTMTISNQDESTQAFGIWLRDIEKYKPCEYFEDKALYTDYDGIMDYMNRFIFRPLKNLITGSRDFDKEFQPLEQGDEDTYEEI